ncbi:MAG: hypothetical protein MUC92_09625 [Fimbriimonadaceae bacterium]|jgi:hypothetical protein|nr:hypothetical protein [Fimbriimonadaceae bacterium]
MLAASLPFLLALVDPGQATPTTYQDQRSGIRFFRDAPPDMFPAYWLREPISAQSEPLASEEWERTRLALLRAMDRYPPSVLKQYLSRIYLVQSMKFYGVGYAGTHTQSHIYIANSGVRRGFSNVFLEATFHHEFAHVLQLRQPKFLDRAGWSAVLPSGFRYLGNGLLAVKSGTHSVSYDASLHPDGFLAEYSKSSLDEDFCLIAEGLFLGKPTFWVAYDRHEKLRRKIDLVIQFYSRIDSSFTEEKFRSWAR